MVFFLFLHYGGDLKSEVLSLPPSVHLFPNISIFKQTAKAENTQPVIRQSLHC